MEHVGTSANVSMNGCTKMLWLSEHTSAAIMAFGSADVRFPGV